MILSFQIDVDDDPRKIEEKISAIRNAVRIARSSNEQVGKDEDGRSSSRVITNDVSDNNEDDANSIVALKEDASSIAKPSMETKDVQCDDDAVQQIDDTSRSNGRIAMTCERPDIISGVKSISFLSDTDNAIAIEYREDVTNKTGANDDTSKGITTDTDDSMDVSDLIALAETTDFGIATYDPKLVEAYQLQVQKLFEADYQKHKDNRAKLHEKSEGSRDKHTAAPMAQI